MNNKKENDCIYVYILNTYEQNLTGQHLSIILLFLNAVKMKKQVLFVYTGHNS